MPKPKGIGKGWWFESQRHRLAGMGIKTGRKTNESIIPDAPRYEGSKGKKDYRTFIKNLKEYLIKGFRLGEKEAEHLIAEIKEKSPEVWGWLKGQFKLKDKGSGSVFKQSPPSQANQQSIFQSSAPSENELSRMSDRELRMMAIRYKGRPSFLSLLFGSANPYEREYLRRLKRKEELTLKVKELKKKLKQERHISLWDIMFGGGFK